MADFSRLAGGADRNAARAPRYVPPDIASTIPGAQSGLDAMAPGVDMTRQAGLENLDTPTDWLAERRSVVDAQPDWKNKADTWLNENVGVELPGTEQHFAHQRKLQGIARALGLASRYWD